MSNDLIWQSLLSGSGIQLELPAPPARAAEPEPEQRMRRDGLRARRGEEGEPATPRDSRDVTSTWPAADGHRFEADPIEEPLADVPVEPPLAEEPVGPGLATPPVEPPLAEEPVGPGLATPPDEPALAEELDPLAASEDIDDSAFDWLADFAPSSRSTDDVEELLSFSVGRTVADASTSPTEPEPEPDAEPEPEPATPRERAVALAGRLGLAYVDLTEFAVDPTVVGMINDQMARRHVVLPIARAADRIVVVLADPENVVVLDDVAAMVRAPIVAVVAEPEAILTAIDRYHRVDSEVEELTSAFAGASETETEQWSQDVGDAGTDEAPIIRFVNLIISQAITDRASDIHIEPMRDELRVRYRIDGVLTTVQRVPRSMIPGVISRLKVMAELDIGERRKPQDGRISVTHSGRTVDLRVATLPTVWGEKVVARVLDSPVASLKLDDLGMLDRNMDVFSASFSKPYGMILVTGPTGSGKSTTLYTTLATISKPTVNVITVEDPVEYRMPGINQVQVNMKAGMTFAAALRSILRSDPDVILIGEIRDEETAKIAIESSLTGHLVLSTLHTNDAPSSVTRLIEMGVEPFLVGSALDSVVAQRLARRLCDRCKSAEPATEVDMRIVGVPLGTYDTPPTVYRPVGCAQCSKTGYRGRIALHEVMAVDDEIERLASRNSPAAEIAAHAESIGMTRLRMDGWAKVLLGHTSVEEILRVTI